MNVFAIGVVVPDAIEASQVLRNEGIFANVVVVTSPDLLYRGWQQASKLKMKNPASRFSFHLERLVPPAERQVPVVTVMDGHSHALSFIGSVFGTKTIPLGVNEFGQTGSRDELYDHYDIGKKAIIEAVRLAVES